jgi:acyl-CoA thioester hydrolase
MKKSLTYKGAVMTWECDSNHHMNVMYYVNKFEHAGRHFLAETGGVLTGSDKRIGVVVLEQTIKYQQEVREDDLLYIESRLLHIGNKAFSVFHEMYNGQTQALVSTMKGVFVLFDKEKRKAMPFPPDKREALLQEWGLKS